VNLNANSAKCHLRSWARSRDLWMSRSWNEGPRSRLGLGLGITGLGLSVSV